MITTSNSTFTQVPSPAIMLLAGLSLSSAASAQDAMEWATIDGGGIVVSFGEGLEMSSSIGQHDAGVMGSGSTVLYGGFWSAAVESPCPADYNQDGGVDGQDVQAFFDAWESGRGSADINQDGGIDGQDVQFFFEAWENGGC